ncbi:hypothetical protein KFE25_001129 [Diacronema lutheri]|uniref:Uncharacterized protein n=1 Tax=Diacronema lutheri TaxID=2081491 RepID=A0A8J6C9F1_DIALT|nr:hypothetical protein KFE25_001129 [Diacronema lutheri]
MAADDAKKNEGKFVMNVQAEVARDMIRFADERRVEMQPLDLATISRWRAFASVQTFSWGVATSAVAYVGARLAAPRGPLPTASKAITVAAFIIGGASALPATAPQLIYDVQRLPTPFGEYVRESLKRHSAGRGPSSRPVGVGDETPPHGMAPGPDASPFDAAPPGAVNQWGDPIVHDADV